MSKYIIHNRKWYNNNTSVGTLDIMGKEFCYTLEDTVRPYGIKVRGYTAIPENSIEGYKVGIRYSPSFKRDMLILYTEDDRETLKHAGVTFKYIYAHGGNDADDTDACVLVAKNRYKFKIQGSMEKELFTLVKGWLDAGEEVVWITKNHKQSE
jgi:hypothetical protein